MDEREDLQRLTLEECNVILTNKLDVATILPHLIAKHLLTKDDREVLMMYAKTQVEKAQYLLDILPRKANGWFEKFMECLQETTDGTGHGDLVKELETKLQELAEKNAPKKGKKKIFKLGSKPSSVEEQQKPVGSGQSDVSNMQYIGVPSPHY